jgi:hypothetical protein
LEVVDDCLFDFAPLELPAAVEFWLPIFYVEWMSSI